MTLQRVAFIGAILSSALIAQRGPSASSTSSYDDLKITPGFDLTAIDQKSESLRRFLPVRVRHLAEEQPHSRGPIRLGPVQ